MQPTAEQTTLPFAPLNPEDMGNRQTARDNAQLGQQVMKIPLDKLIIREGLNSRVDYGDIPELGRSLLQNGQRVPGRVDILTNGSFAIVAGHRRLEGWKWAQKETGEVAYFYAIVNTSGDKTTDEDRLFDQFITQHEKPLEQHEVAELFSRLIILGNSAKSIATRTGTTPAYISMMLKFSREPQEIKDAVIKKRLTVDTAVKLIGKIPNAEDRITALQSAEEKKFDKKQAAGEKEDEGLIYDEDLKRTRPKEASGNPDDIVNTVPDNTKTSKKLQLEEITGSTPVFIPTLASVRKAIEALEPPEGNPSFNKGYAEAICTVLEFFKSSATKKD